MRKQVFVIIFQTNILHQKRKHRIVSILEIQGLYLMQRYSNEFDYFFANFDNYHCLKDKINIAYFW